MLAGMVAPAAPGAIGFDTAIPLNARRIGEFKAQGFRFCVRYLSRTDASRAANAAGGGADLSETEADLILDAGLALMAVQHVARTGWVPSAALGKLYGENAAHYAAAAGLPPGVTVWLDLEDIPKGTAAGEIIGYCNAWFAPVRAAGFVPGVYVGFDVWLTPEQLFFDLHTQHYWRAAGDITDIAHRGYQMFQHIVMTTDGRKLDKNVAMTDVLGGAAMWLERAPAGG